MSRLDLLDEFTQSDMAMFQKICRKLLKMTFIVKEKNDEHRKDFMFVKNHTDAFEEYFARLGIFTKKRCGYSNRYHILEKNFFTK